MNTALVTGATGFIGSHLADALYELGFNVVVSGSGGEADCKHHVMLPSDLRGLESVGKVDVCFHQAAHNDTTDKDIRRMFAANCLFSSNLFDRVHAMGCRKIIYASSASVYGFCKSPQAESMESEPTNPYSRSKDILESVASGFSEKRNCVTVGLRYFNVYGQREEHKGRRASMVYQLCKSALSGREIEVFKWGEQSRDWVAVEDVVQANIACMRCEESNIFNVGSGKSVSINELLDIISNELGRQVNRKYVENPFLESYQNHTMADISKISHKVGYAPKVEIKEGVANLIRYIKKSPDIIGGFFQNDL